jgi:protein ImuA
MSRELLTALRERVRRIERPAATMHGVVTFGIAPIDRALPGGGLARGAVHEILGMGGDEEDGALAAAFAAGILARLIAVETRIVLWCLRRPDLYGAGLGAHGLYPARLVLVGARRDAEILWAMEEGLRAPGVAAVVGEVGSLPAVASRRLQLAAEHSGVTAFLLRRWRDGGQAARERNLPNAAATRWRVAALPSRSSPTRLDGLVLPLLSPTRGRESFKEPGIGCPRWRVELLRCRGGEPACWEVEVTDAAGSLSLAEAVADRPAAPLRVDVRSEHAGGESFRRAG